MKLRPCSIRAEPTGERRESGLTSDPDTVPDKNTDPDREEEIEPVANALVESGDIRHRLIMTHREEWIEIDYIRMEAMKAFKGLKDDSEAAYLQGGCRSTRASTTAFAGAVGLEPTGERRESGLKGIKAKLRP